MEGYRPARINGASGDMPFMAPPLGRPDNAPPRILRFKDAGTFCGGIAPVWWTPMMLSQQVFHHAQDPSALHR